MRPHNLVRLASKVYNTPHLITASAFNVVLDYLEKRNSFDINFQVGGDSSQEVETQTGAVGESGVGFLYVDGSLTYKPVITACGEVGTSYKSLVSQTLELIEAGTKTIVMEVSSGGGEASHVFETANYIRQLCDDHDVALIGYADTMACSAAYGLICVADVVIANPSAELGSIGCVVALMDTSKAMEMAGLKRVFITSGEAKVPFAEDGSFKPEFIESVQERVNSLNQEFASHVSKYTSLDTKTIMDFEAKVFEAEEALSNGLCDAVMTTSEFMQYVATYHKGIKNEA